MSAKNITPAGGAFGGSLAQQAGQIGFPGMFPSGSLGIMSRQNTGMGPPFGISAGTMGQSNNIFSMISQMPGRTKSMAMNSGMSQQSPTFSFGGGGRPSPFFA